jgi:hypothetical protein
VLEWRDGGAEATVRRGKHLASMGVSAGGRLFPEEVLFLAETCAAAVVTTTAKREDCNATVAATPQEVWSLCLDAGMSLDHYVVYSHLKRLGFVVHRHGVVIPRPSPKKAKKPTKTEATSTPADKDIRCRGWWPVVLPVAAAVAVVAKVAFYEPLAVAPGSLVLPFAFDVWRPDSRDKFRRIQPHFRLVVALGSDPPPTPSEVSNLIAFSFPVPVRIAVCSGGDASFFTLAGSPS